ncbi:MAG: hypothetical protein FWD31_10805 [Planctomycetaceae bacterium]|nr:hypothetical protein [Planctomycetaceae bacterium]
MGGVELAENIYAICTKNMQALGYRDVTVIHKNVTELRDELDDFNVFYMFNPFPADPMRIFMRSIAESVKRKRRAVYVVYQYPLYADACREEGFVVLKEMLTHSYFMNDKPTLILEHRTSQ